MNEEPRPPIPWPLDHKVLGRLYLAYGLFFLAVGGAMALLIRWQLAHPGTAMPLVGPLLLPRTHGVVSPNGYAALFTLHGTVMLFFAITPIVIGCLGSFLVPLQVGARNVAFPKLNLLAFLFLLAAGVVLLASLFVPLGPAASGWTAYPPLSTPVGQPGPGQTMWVVAVLLNGVSSVLGAINTLTTVLVRRARGLTLWRLPLTTWGLLYTSVLNVLFVPVVAIALVLLLCDRLLGTQLFIAGATLSRSRGGGDPVLYQHLFWIFGHPEVYIVILPVWGLVSDLLSFFSRKPAFSYRTSVLAMGGITLLSMLVYGHHMFVVGLSPLLTQAFMTLTMLISVPTSILFLNWLGTLWKGSIRFTSPMLYALSVVLVFAIGGLTGIHLGAISSDVYLHDSAFVVGHFHLTMAASVLLGAFAAIHFWFPKITGRMLDDRLSRLHVALTVVPMILVFGGMLVLGYGGMPRRIYDPSAYRFLAHLGPLNVWITNVAFVLGSGQVLFLINVIVSVFWGRKAEANPWDVGTLEWTLTSPPPRDGFERLPVVLHGPHELSDPRVPHKDWLAQDEALP